MSNTECLSCVLQLGGGWCPSHCLNPVTTFCQFPSINVLYIWSWLRSSLLRSLLSCVLFLDSASIQRSFFVYFCCPSGCSTMKRRPENRKKTQRRWPRATLKVRRARLTGRDRAWKKTTSSSPLQVLIDCILQNTKGRPGVFLRSE